MLLDIFKFAIRGDSDDSLRQYVTGIGWHDDFLYINIHNLMILTGKSKAGINGTLSELGYNTMRIAGKLRDLFYLKFPMISQNSLEFKQWTVRQPTNKEVLDGKTTEEVIVKEEPEKKESGLEEILFIDHSKCEFGCTCGCTCQRADALTFPPPIRIPCKCITEYERDGIAGDCPCASQFLSTIV